MPKQSSIGPFIRDYLLQPIQKGEKLRPRKVSYPYEMWKAYDIQRKEAHKSIAYNSFLRYIYMMERIGLIKKTDIYIKEKGIRIRSGAAGKQIRLLFTWEDMPGKNEDKLKEYLKRKFKIPWIYEAIIEKSPDNKSITLKKDMDFIYIRLNDTITEASIIGEEGVVSTLIAKKTGKKIKIYYKLKTTSDLIRRGKSKSGTSPQTWYRQYYRAITKLPAGMNQIQWNDMWIRPQYYYRRLLYQQSKYGTIKGKPTKKEYEKKHKELREKQEITVPEIGEITTIKVSKQLVEYIKANMKKGDTYNSYLSRLMNLS